MFFKRYDIVYNIYYVLTKKETSLDKNLLYQL